MRMSTRPAGICAVAMTLLVIGGCGESVSTLSDPSPTPTPTPVSARAIAVKPPDFPGVSLRVCPGPATGDFAAYAAAYRKGIKRQPLILAANLAAAKAA